MGNENRSIVNSSWKAAESVDKITILFKDKDPKKGMTLQQNKIIQILITESMFSLLPTISITFEDSGRFFYEFHIQSGDAIYITISPNQSEAQKNAKPILDGKFIIQNIQMDKIDPTKESALFEVTGIYSVETYLNEVFSYPEFTVATSPDNKPKQSCTAIQEIVSKIGLGFSTDEKLFRDSSYWMSCQETRAQFIDRIVSHAWIEENDAPILYTDKYGTMHYVSVKKLAEGGRCASIKDFKTTTQKRQKANDQVLVTENLSLINATGPILNQGGYVIKQSTYDPYNVNSILKKVADATSKNKDSEQYESNSALDLPNFRSDTKDPNLSFKQSEFRYNESFLKGITTKDPANFDTCTTVSYGGTKFSELHEHYEIAPSHNEMIRRSFFQNFIKLTLDTNRQAKLFTIGKKRPELGEKYYVDFSGHRINKIYSGDYIINKIVHAYVPGCSYTQALYLSSDGYYGVNK